MWICGMAGGIGRGATRRKEGINAEDPGEEPFGFTQGRRKSRRKRASEHSICPSASAARCAIPKSFASIRSTRQRTCLKPLYDFAGGQGRIRVAEDCPGREVVCDWRSSASDCGESCTVVIARLPSPRNLRSVLQYGAHPRQPQEAHRPRSVLVCAPPRQTRQTCKRRAADRRKGRNSLGFGLILRPISYIMLTTKSVSFAPPSPRPRSESGFPFPPFVSRLFSPQALTPGHLRKKRAEKFH